MRTILLFLFFIPILGWSGKAWSVSDLEQPHKYDKTNYVANPDGVLSAESIRRINELLADVDRQTGAEVAIAVVEDYSGTQIDDFATELYNTWGLGNKNTNNGVLLIVATERREWAFRTGRGIGAALTDLQTGRIARNDLIPNFRLGDYDSGITAATKSLHEVLTSPEAMKEMEEASRRSSDEDDLSMTDVILGYLWFCLIFTVLLGIVAIYKVKKTSKMERHQRYVKLHPFQRILYGMSFVSLGLPLTVYLPYRYFLKELRDGKHLCPNCNTPMHKLDEVTDNLRLTPTQDAEERFDSVDYDVWECPNCGEEDIYGFENEDSDLQECAECHAKTARYMRDRVLQMPTTKAEGLGVKEFLCLNCGKTTQKPYRIPKKVNPPTSGPFIYGGSGRGGGGFGGFGGGSFGGGVTGGGGSSGRW